MKFLKNQLDMVHDLVKPGGPLAKIPGAWTLFEMHETILFSVGYKTPEDRGPHSRDALDSKRMMFMVVIALLPAFFCGTYNVGFQALAAEGVAEISYAAAMLRGFFHVLPIVAVTFIAGGVWEVVFATVRNHDVNEGFLVTGFLFPLTLPPTMPLWQVAVSISFGVVIGKEVFGGTGMNILNPALTARAFAFFTYPAAISGDNVWVAANRVPEFAKSFIPHGSGLVDGFSGATPLAVAAAGQGKGDTAVAALKAFKSASTSYDLSSLFWGQVPGSIGEVSLFALLIGAALLLITGVASGRIMLGTVIGVFVMGALLNAVAGTENSPMLHLPPVYHLVMGGFGLGAIFMATDPVSAAVTSKGQWIYGALIGVMVVLIRAVNPAYPEGMMLAILFMNVFAPLIDHGVVQGNIKRRRARLAAS